MAKKSVGASEVNGFIAITNTKPKSTSKVAGAKKSVVSTSSKLKDDAKAVKKPETGPTVKKGVTNEKNVNKMETKDKTTHSIKPPAAKMMKKVEQTKNNLKLAPGAKTSGQVVKSIPVNNRSISDKMSISRPQIKSVGESSKSKTSTSVVKVTPSLKKVDQRVTTVGKAVQDKRVTGGVKSTSVKKPVIINNKRSNEKSKTTEIKTVEMKLETPVTLKAKAKENAVSKEVLGKSGISFNVTLKPPQIVKPQLMPTRIKTKDTENKNVPKSSSTSVANLTSAPLPPPLVKQRTFVKDDEDDELKSSLPHIDAQPNESQETFEISTSNYYEEDNFEDYESDFEDDASRGESSVSEKVVLIPQRGIEIVSANSEDRLDDFKKEPNTYRHTDNMKGHIDHTTHLAAIVEKETEFNKENIAETILETEDSQFNYEDDFEDYSSDFEDDESGFTSSNETSSESTESSTSDVSDDKRIDFNKTNLKGKVIEEEKKLDSGNYDLKTTLMKSETIRQTQLKDIKEAISRENTMFKEGKPESKKPLSPPPTHILDFNEAASRTYSAKKQAKVRSRGLILLNMVKLHTINIDLFEMKPLCYEDYIKLRGNANNIQRQTQTGDNNQSEEVQTEDINTQPKWTQWPPSHHSWIKRDIDWGVYLEDKRGFGSGDHPNLDPKHFFPRHYNAKRLLNFVTNTSQLMTVILEEELGPRGFKNALSLQKTEAAQNFSDGYVSIYCDDIDFLKNRKVTHVLFSPHFANVLLTCYDKSEDSNEFLLPEVSGKWLICLWDVIAVSQPIKVLVASAPITAIAFDCLYSDLVYAGLSDGIVSLWDLSEPDVDHDHFSSHNFKSILRTPTFCTFSNQMDLDETHTSTIVGLRSVSSSGKRGQEDNITIPTMLFSLSEDGKLIIWTVLRGGRGSTKNQRKIDARMSPWGQVWMSLLSIHTPADKANTNLRTLIDFTCFEVKKDVSVLLGTNMGFVLQYPLNRLKCLVPQFGDTSEQLYRLHFCFTYFYFDPKDPAAMVTAIELCPQDSHFFLVGLSDGSIRLYNEDIIRPLKYMAASSQMTEGICSVCWSLFKTDIILALDENTNLLLWNIRVNNSEPILKIRFNNSEKDDNLLMNVVRQSGLMVGKDMGELVKNLFPTTCRLRKSHQRHIDLSKDARLPYIAIIARDTSVQVHRFNAEFAENGDNSEELMSYLTQFTSQSIKKQ